MQRLVERAAGRVQPLGEDVDRDAVQRDRDEHLALVGAERVADRVAQRTQQLALGELLVRRQRARGDRRPAAGLERQLARLPRPAAHVHRRLVERELVGPRREAALAAEAVELAQHRNERVVGRLTREVVVIAAAQMGERRTAP